VGVGVLEDVVLVVKALDFIVVLVVIVVVKLAEKTLSYID
jgi:hypothetical protein